MTAQKKTQCFLFHAQLFRVREFLFFRLIAFYAQTGMLGRGIVHQTEKGHLPLALALGHGLGPGNNHVHPGQKGAAGAL